MKRNGGGKELNAKGGFTREKCMLSIVTAPKLVRLIDRRPDVNPRIERIACDGGESACCRERTFSKGRGWSKSHRADGH